MSNQPSNVTLLGDKASVRAMTAQLRRGKRGAVGVGQSAGAALAAGRVPRKVPGTNPKIHGLLEWGVLGGVWGGLFGLGFAMIFVPMASLGVKLLAPMVPVILAATLASIVVLSIGAVCVGAVVSVIGRVGDIALGDDT